MKNPRKTLIEMLKYKRKHGSQSHISFCNKFLKPVFGKPDIYGNFIKVIGNNPNISFMSHHDSVHTTNGKQVLSIENDIVKAVNSECLGADCATGIWLMLEMIQQNIEGVYVVHAQEESGCIGSRALVDSSPDWLEHVDIAISFDRKGMQSIITHQMGLRCCSEQFSDELSTILDLNHVSDDTGSYTDSNEYIGKVSECTNLSVGYYKQHTRDESQDLNYAMNLRESLINAEWEALGFYRDSDEVEYSYFNDREESYYSGNPSLERLIEQYPDEVADVLRSLGVTADMLVQEINDMYGFKDSRVGMYR